MVSEFLQQILRASRFTNMRPCPRERRSPSRYCP